MAGNSSFYFSVDAAGLPCSLTQFWHCLPGDGPRPTGGRLSPTRLPHFTCQLKVRLLPLELLTYRPAVN